MYICLQDIQLGHNIYKTGQEIPAKLVNSRMLELEMVKKVNKKKGNSKDELLTENSSDVKVEK